MVYSVPIHQIVNEFHLRTIYATAEHLDRRISDTGINRPGLQLTGFFEYFKPNRVQVMGMAEKLYIEGLSPSARTTAFRRLFEKGVCMLILTRNTDPFPECLEMAKEYSVPIFGTSEPTSEFVAALTAALSVHLGPRTVMHGVFVEVYGEGILLIGDSGIGKSETAIELLKRGHRLVADDAVEVKRVSAKTLVGSAPEMIRYFVELRGIGIIDVRRIFGMGAVKPTEKVDLIIHLEHWDDNKLYDRMGLEDDYTEILDIKVPSLHIPVRPGRNLAIIIEVAAMNNRNKKTGYNAAKELSDKLYANMLAKQDDKK